jgi:hypothetical protein
MVADLVPIRLSLSAGDHYTVWAPRWRDAGDEWEAFLGKDDDLYAFETVSDLVARNARTSSAAWAASRSSMEEALHGWPCPKLRNGSGR